MSRIRAGKFISYLLVVIFATALTFGLTKLEDKRDVDHYHPPFATVVGSTQLCHDELQSRWSLGYWNIFFRLDHQLQKRDQSAITKKTNSPYFIDVTHRVNNRFLVKVPGGDYVVRLIASPPQGERANVPSNVGDYTKATLSIQLMPGSVTVLPASLSCASGGSFPF